MGGLTKKSFKISIVELGFEYFKILKGVGSYVYLVSNQGPWLHIQSNICNQTQKERKKRKAKY